MRAGSGAPGWMSPPTPSGGVVSTGTVSVDGGATGVVPGTAGAVVPSCTVVPVPTAWRGAQPPLRQISPAAQSAPLVHGRPLPGVTTGATPPSNARVTPGARPTAARAARPRSTCRRLARRAPGDTDTANASNLRAFML